MVLMTACSTQSVIAKGTKIKRPVMKYLRMVPIQTVLSSFGITAAGCSRCATGGRRASRSAVS